MSASVVPLSPQWQFYAEYAHQTHIRRVDDFGYGCEECLWETLAAVESGSPFSDECRKRLERIPWNRAKKYRRLRYRRAVTAVVGAAETFRVDVGDSIDRVRALLSADEWDVEWRLAHGATYAEVARGRDVSASSLKVKASRWRARIRSVC
jgi:hypothetical protein